MFLSLINDLFPGLQLDSSTYDELQAAVAHQVEEAGLVNHPPWNLKLVQVKLFFKIFFTIRSQNNVFMAKPLSYPRTCTSNMGKTEGCVCTPLRKTNARDLHCGACRSSSWTDTSLYSACRGRTVYASSYKILSPRRTTTVLCHSVHSYLYRQTDVSTANLMLILKDK